MGVLRPVSGARDSGRDPYVATFACTKHIARMYINIMMGSSFIMNEHNVLSMQAFKDPIRNKDLCLCNTHESLVI